jgi:hypothetical protein
VPAAVAIQRALVYDDGRMEQRPICPKVAENCYRIALIIFEIKKWSQNSAGDMEKSGLFLQ